MLPKLIGITGKAGAGKDTLADMLCDLQDAEKYNFARPLKEALNAMFGWTMSQWDDREWKERVIPWLGKSPRYLAQTIGTEWGRELIHPELWVRIAEQRYIQHIDAFGDERPFVIPDVRFDNEAVMIQQMGGVVLQLERPSAAAVLAHKSENGVQPSLITATVVNDSTHHELYVRAMYQLRFGGKPA